MAIIIIIIFFRLILSLVVLCGLFVGGAVNMMMIE